MEALAARRGVPLPNLAAGQTFPMTVGSRHGPYHTVYVTEAFGLAYDLTLWLLGATVISCVILAAKGIVEETRGRSEKLAELKAGLDPAHMTEEERHYAGAWADLARRWRIVWMTLGSIALVWLGGGGAVGADLDNNLRTAILSAPLCATLAALFYLGLFRCPRCGYFFYLGKIDLSDVLLATGSTVPGTCNYCRLPRGVPRDPDEGRPYVAPSWPFWNRTTKWMFIVGFGLFGLVYLAIRIVTLRHRGW